MLNKSFFPIFSNYPDLIYLDSAATTQKPHAVLEAIQNYYEHSHANVRRGAYQLAEASTSAWVDSHQIITDFFGAASEELIMTRNCTEALNLVAFGWGRSHVSAGDVVVVTEDAHHSNFVPWQILAQEKEAELLVLPVTNEGVLDIGAAQQMLMERGSRVKAIALTMITNVIGVRQPVDELALWIRQQVWGKRAWIVYDGAQAAGHEVIDFAKLPADALAFAGHKMYGPMGSGGLLIKKDQLSELSPFLFGGGMIESVSVDKTNFSSDYIDRFTAGTPDVASAVGLAAAATFLRKSDVKKISVLEKKLVEKVVSGLAKMAHVELLGPLDKELRSAAVAFLVNGVHAHDVAAYLDSKNIAVRSGHHCAMPLHTRFGWSATTRVSLGIYNSLDDVEAFLLAMRELPNAFYRV